MEIQRGEKITHKPSVVHEMFLTEKTLLEKGVSSAWRPAVKCNDNTKIHGTELDAAGQMIKLGLIGGVWSPLITPSESDSQSYAPEKRHSPLKKQWKRQNIHSIV
ncbi:hypothetical protein ILYODFUR_012459 [Ilyodon furcidens]|uniref:Uncharacterized protein n=1 Tax=Ilyodon furcidens TaxID=33524 RepID=A0ABV0U4U6_9TELE